MKTTKIRTRIAPSPTGDPHVGTAYIALFNYCFSQQQGGDFILRIEDTDAARSTKASEEKILASLKWLGLTWAEGPDVGGPFAPYRQSERKDIYQAYAHALVEKGHAFYCFRTPEEVNALREARIQQGLPAGFKVENPELPLDVVEQYKKEGRSYVIRLKVPMSGTCRVEDVLRGSVEIPWEQVDMQILLKADGLPTYHLANVVDDHLMEITHVIRGEEWINSTPKHLLLYQYFGWQAPVFCHLPLLRNVDKSKLSKRKNPTSILYYQRMGYLAEAVLNYLGRMGWSMPDEREKFTLSEMIEHFDLNRVSLGGPVFDVEKLKWLNGLWIRENLTAEAFAVQVQAWALNKDYLMSIVPHIKERVVLLSDLPDLTALFFFGLPKITPESFAALKLEKDQIRRVFFHAIALLEKQNEWHKEAIYHTLSGLSKTMGLKFKDFIAPFFVAISGQTSAAPVMDSMAVIGSDLSLARLRHALNTLGAVSEGEFEEMPVKH
jgi:glutamyl-tRNA synthetase